MTSATREVMPVVRLRVEDGSRREFPAGGGIVPRAYNDLVKRYVSENATLRLL